MTIDFEAGAGPFGQMAFDLCDLDLAPIPTGGEDGKSPLLNGYNKGLVNFGNVKQFQQKFASCNIALVCGPSRLNVIDLDDPNLLHPMRKRFGETPLITKTAGRGGYHLFYRAHPLIKPIDFRRTESLDMEIKARGNIVLVPPSVNPHTGKRYEFIEGRLDAETLSQLPRFKADAVPVGRSEKDRVEQGRRNDWLFSQCMKSGHYVDTRAELLDYAQTRNEECDPPLGASEVVRIVDSAWGYTQRGMNFCGSRGVCVFSEAEVDELARRDPGNPAYLLMKLRIEHSYRVKRGETFALATEAMARDATLEGWTRWHHRSAVEKALSQGLIERVSGGRGKPTRYTLGSLDAPNTKPRV